MKRPEKMHDLKVWPEAFDALLDGTKTFEWRFDDRGFEVGDWLCLREWRSGSQEYTGRATQRQITYILRGRFGVPEGYVVLALNPLERQPEAR